MRIDLLHGEHRPLAAKLGLAFFQLVVGIKPGPVLVMSYRPDLFGRGLQGYMLRGVAHAGPWSKGESELMAAFVSDLNTCRF